MAPNLVTKFFSFVAACFSWMPTAFSAMVVLLITIKCADAFLGIWDRAWRVFGR